MKKIPIIDTEKCTLCKSCIEMCPQKVLIEKNGSAAVTVDECMLCSHCYSVCPVSAIRFDEQVLRDPKFKTLSKSISNRFQSISPEYLIQFVRSRRSVRKYKSTSVSQDTLLDLVEFAHTGPSGSNCQDWEFIIVNGRNKVWDLAGEIKKFFSSLNRLARNPIIRYLSFLFIGKALISYYRNHMESVEMGLQEAEKGRDILFHSAPSVIIVHSCMEGSTPIEDAQFAAYNITLLAQAMGLGTCFIGYAVEAINRAQNVKKYLGIPSQNRAHAVLAIGYPDVTFHKPALRKKVRVKTIK